MISFPFIFKGTTYNLQPYEKLYLPKHNVIGEEKRHHETLFVIWTSNTNFASVSNNYKLFFSSYTKLYVIE
ncbi:hypothetical protein VNO80_31601 [Phaseolus coccineus]|uniref:Uncharacterized protein n=1 Tax=Phaseolus coccineus TaxID=3886 RepID=A0AAN9L1Z1_PHACN